MTKQDRFHARRDFLKTGTAAALLPWLPRGVFAGDGDSYDYRLTAAVGGCGLTFRQSSRIGGYSTCIRRWSSK